VAEPGGCPRVIEPGAEIQVGIPDGCRRGARRRACADPLACNFLATETPADGRLCWGRAGRPTGADASEGIVVNTLQDVACAVLDGSHTSEVVGDVVEDLVIARAGQEASAFPASALEGERSVGCQGFRHRHGRPSRWSLRKLQVAFRPRHIHALPCFFYRRCSSRSVS